MAYLFFSVIGLGFLAFLYFGYRNDYKRNPKEFLTTIFSVLFMGGLFLLIRLAEIEVPIWISFLMLISFAILYWFKSRPNTTNKK